MMGIVLIVLCLLGTGIQYSVAVDELSESIVSIVNETNYADIGHGEFNFQNNIFTQNILKKSSMGSFCHC